LPAPERPQRPTIADRLTRLSYAQIAGWRDDDHALAFAAFLRSAHQIVETPPTKRHRAIDLNALVAVAHRAILSGPMTAQTARRFFEEHFEPARIDAAGFVTGYYEPELAASPVRTGQFLVPIHKRPPDLIDPPAGCRFAPRCARAEDQCHRAEPPLAGTEAGHQFACWRPLDAAEAAAP